LSRGPAAELKQVLAGLQTRHVARLLVRSVPQLDFDAGEPRRYLFASGVRNRCNPKGVACLYFSEEEETARAEYEAQWRGTPKEHQPKLIFTARVNLRRVVDLGDTRALEALHLTDEDLFGSWLLKTSPTPLEKIGRAIARQRAITALRYPSAATHRLGRVGWNLAIFRAALKSPDRIEILGKSGDPLEVLP
jgi:RES domain-containing protein